MTTSKIVDFNELLYEKNNLIFFKRQLFNGVMLKKIGEEDNFGNYLIELICVKDGKRNSNFFPPFFPKNIFDLKNLQYMSIINEYELGIFPDSFNHSEFTGILFQGSTDSVPMPLIPTNIQDMKEWEEELKNWHNEYKNKTSLDFPLNLNDLEGNCACFYAVIKGQNKINGRIIYKTLYEAGSLVCIVNGVKYTLPKHIELFDLNNHN